MAKLVLDPFCVLSAWEKMGGSAFSSDDVQSDDPAAFPLDLSSWEASMKPLSMPAPPCTDYNSSIFCSLFPSQELGLGFLPSCFAPLPLGPPNTFPAAPTESAQVVPMCPASSTGGSDTFPFSSTTTTNNNLRDLHLPLGSEDFNHTFDDSDADFNLQLSDIDAVYSATASPTRTSSLEAPVVPDGPSGSQHLPASPPATTSATASSAESQPVPASVALELPAAIEPCRPGLARPTPTLPAGYFVPVNSQPHLPPTAASTSDIVIKPEPLTTGQDWCQQPHPSAGRQTPPLPTTQAPSPAPCADAAPTADDAAARAVAAAPHPAPPRPQPAAATAAAGALTHGSGAVHIRTRAECLERYRQKKARRLTSKKIRYHLRKINADKRPRIKGRFVKKEELEEFLASQRGGGPAACGHEAYYEADDAYHMGDSDDE